MGRLIGGLLDNDSPFGRLMNRLWIIIAANLMFAVCCLGVVTVGPGLVALYHVMLKCLHERGEVRPVFTFWRAFRENLKQGLAWWIAFLLLAGVLAADLLFCRQAGGVWRLFLYALFVLLAVLVILAVYLVPVMAAFADTLPHLLRNALFFASRRPMKIPLAVGLWAVPLTVTVLDTRMRPLYGFLWTVCGFGLIAMMESELLYRDLAAYLPSEEGGTDGGEEAAGTAPGPDAGSWRSRRQILREMKKMDEAPTEKEIPEASEKKGRDSRQSGM